MIKLLKNKEVRKALLWQLLLSAAACAVCFFFDIRAGLTAAGLSLLLMLVFCISTYKRYQRISSLADDIDQILHGDHAIDFDSYSEGELSILHSEIYKMTIRLREQQQTLTREKAYLADSIADISHQIRTPLTSINLLIGLLSEPKLTDARRQQLIHELYELLSRIDWLITTLLKISRLDAGTVQFKQEQVSLEELLKKSCVTLLIPMELRGQALLIHADGAFRGDLSWTSEAIGNIVKNCMEHTPEGGRIEIDAAENATSLAARSVLTGTGFIHNKCTAALHCAVETFDRSVGLACFGHFDETETFGTAGLAISYKTDASHVSVSRESCFEFIC